MESCNHLHVTKHLNCDPRWSRDFRSTSQAYAGTLGNLCNRLLWRVSRPDLNMPGLKILSAWHRPKPHFRKCGGEHDNQGESYESHTDLFEKCLIIVLAILFVLLIICAKSVLK